MTFWPLCCENEAMLTKTFRLSNRAGVLIWENFHPGLYVVEISVGKAETSAADMNMLKLIPRMFSGVPRSRKPSQPGQPGSCEEALNTLL